MRPRKVREACKCHCDGWSSNCEASTMGKHKKEKINRLWGLAFLRGPLSLSLSLSLSTFSFRTKSMAFYIRVLFHVPYLGHILWVWQRVILFFSYIMLGPYPLDVGNVWFTFLLCVLALCMTHTHTHIYIYIYIYVCLKGKLCTLYDGNVWLGGHPLPNHRCHWPWSVDMHSSFML